MNKRLHHVMRVALLVMALAGAAGAATNATYRSDQFTYRGADETGLESVELRELGLVFTADPSRPDAITLTPTQSLMRIERIQEPDRIGLEAVTTGGCRVIYLRATGEAPIRLQQLGVSARCVVMENHPGHPMHGLLFDAAILPAPTNAPPAWPSIHQAVAGSEPRTITLPRDCEFAVSEAFEVVAPVPRINADSTRP